MEEKSGKIWKPPEGKFMDDGMGLVSKEEVIEKSVKYVTKHYLILLGIVMGLYFILWTVEMFFFEDRGGGGRSFSSASFMFVVFMALAVNSRIDALVGLLKVHGLLEPPPVRGNGGQAEENEEAAPETKTREEG